MEIITYKISIAIGMIREVRILEKIVTDKGTSR